MNVALGVATGLLVGFVLGSVLGAPDSSVRTSGPDNAKGNVMNISRFGRNPSVDETSEAQPGDSLKLSAIDENGEEMQIVIIKSK